MLKVLQKIKTKFSEQGKMSRYHSLDITAASILINEITQKSVAQVFFEDVFQI